jgi:hypothetical protein
MAGSWKDNHALFLIVIGGLAWLIPGAGHFALNERSRGIVIFVMIALTFAVGLYVGSIGVVNPVSAKPWYVAQVMNSPVVFLLGSYMTAAHQRAEAQNDLSLAYPVYGRAGEVGQIYTSIAGLLNLLCIVNAIYMAHRQVVGEEGSPK